MRVKGGPHAKNRRKKVLQLAEGFRGRSKNSNKLARQAVDRALVYAYRDRKTLKREMRSLWITRITAAARLRGLSYSRFMGALKAKNIELNRKMLADLAVTDSSSFDQVVKAAGF